MLVSGRRGRAILLMRLMTSFMGMMDPVAPNCAQS